MASAVNPAMFSCSDHPILSPTFPSNILEKKKCKDLNLSPAKKTLHDFWLACASPLSSLTEKLSLLVTGTQVVQQWKIQAESPNSSVVQLHFQLVPARWDANASAFLPGFTQFLNWISKMAWGWSCHGLRDDSTPLVLVGQCSPHPGSRSAQ